MKTVLVGKYVLTFDPSSVSYETYDDGYAYGVKFREGAVLYDAFCHEHLGERLLVDGRDIPLSVHSAHLLPHTVNFSLAPLVDGKPTLDREVSTIGSDGKDSPGRDS